MSHSLTNWTDQWSGLRLRKTSLDLSAIVQWDTALSTGSRMSTTNLAGSSDCAYASTILFRTRTCSK